MRPRVAAVLLAIPLGLAVACAADRDDADGAGWTVTADTSEAGVVRVVNIPPAAEPGPDQVIEEELRIGIMEGGGAEQFGQIRGIAALGDGRIAVLDAQAKEVRVFGADGAHRATFGGQGAGPGELEGPWGLMRDSRDGLWVPDHANHRMTVFHPDSGYVRSYPMQVLRYGYIWDGVMLEDGRIVEPSITLVPERREMLRIHDSRMELVDSILQPARGDVAPEDVPSMFYWEAPGGMPQGYINVPFYPRAHSTFDPQGNVWTSAAGGEPAYQVTRASLRGDTSLVIENRREPVPVADAARDSAIDAIREHLREQGARADRDWSRIPRTRPAIEQLFVAENGQLWVRTASPDSLIRFDIYGPDGTVARTAATRLPVDRYISPIVRGDGFWAVVSDEFGVQYVVRGRITAPGTGDGP